jgi:hypothetical protein
MGLPLHSFYDPEKQEEGDKGEIHDPDQNFFESGDPRL